MMRLAPSAAMRWLAFGCLLAACTPHQPPAAANSPGAAVSPSASTAPIAASPSGLAASPAAANSGAAPTPVRIRVRGRKVGSQYISATRQKGNRTVYKLRADSESGDYFGSDTGQTSFVNPHVIFFGKGGEQIVADAPVGTAFERDKTIRMSGGVHAHTADGKTLTSDTLTYADPNDTLVGDGNVILTSPAGYRLEGQRMVWNMSTGHIEVTAAR